MDIEVVVEAGMEVVEEVGTEVLEEALSEEDEEASRLVAVADVMVAICEKVVGSQVVVERPMVAEKIETGKCHHPTEKRKKMADWNECITHREIVSYAIPLTKQ